jgi:hypothetical protein
MDTSRVAIRDLRASLLSTFFPRESSDRHVLRPKSESCSESQNPECEATRDPEIKARLACDRFAVTELVALSPRTCKPQRPPGYELSDRTADALTRRVSGRLQGSKIGSDQLWRAKFSQKFRLDRDRRTRDGQWSLIDPSGSASAFHPCRSGSRSARLLKVPDVKPCL